MPRLRLGLSLLIALSVAACGSDDVTAPPPSEVECDGGPTEVLTLAPFGEATVRGDALRCVALAGDGASYVIAAQFATSTLPYGGYAFRLGAPDASPTASASPMASLDANATLREAQGWDLDAQARADRWLRDTESRTRPDKVAANKSVATAVVAGIGGRGSG